MTLVLYNFLILLSFVLWILIIARVVVSWVAPTGGGGLVAFIYQVTEPILARSAACCRPPPASTGRRWWRCCCWA